MTISVQLETRIARPVPDVFAALIDIESYPTWLVASGITKVQLLDAGPPEGISIDIDTVVAPDEMSTRLRWSLRIGLPLRYRLFESMVAPQARQAAAVDLEAFRRRLESPIAG